MTRPQPPDDIRTIPINTSMLQKGLLNLLTPQRNAAIVWQDRDAEVLFLAEGFKAGLRDGLIVIEIMLRSDQTQDASIILTYSVGSSPSNAALLATTPEHPAGHTVLSRRWGQVAQDLLWRNLLLFAQTMIDKELGEGEMKLGGLYVQKEHLHLIPIPYYSIDDVIKARA